MWGSSMAFYPLHHSSSIGYVTLVANAGTTSLVPFHPYQDTAIDQIYNQTMHQFHIPQCTSPISHNVPFCNRNVLKCAHFYYKLVHCGISVKCIMGFVRLIYSFEDEVPVD